MKKFLNWYILTTFFISIGIIVFVFYSYQNQKEDYRNDIGDILFDKKLDASSFKICDSLKVFQYFSTKTDYLGGARAIKNELLPKINERNIQFGNKSGIITFRFIVNCEGEIGRFRMFQVDENQQKTNFNEKNINNLKKLVKTLSNWKIKKFDKKTYDSYFIIRFIINNGKIVDIF